jgi:hypothetical protein
MVDTATRRRRAVLPRRRRPSSCTPAAKLRARSKGGACLRSGIRVLAIERSITDNWYITADAESRIPSSWSSTAEHDQGAWHTSVGLPVPGPRSPHRRSERTLALIRNPCSRRQTTSTFSVINTTAPAKPVVSNPDARDSEQHGQGSHCWRMQTERTSGTVTIAFSSSSPVQCDRVRRQRAQVPSTAPPSPAKPPPSRSEGGATGGSAGFAFDYQSRYDVLVFPLLRSQRHPRLARKTGVLGSAVELLPSTWPINGPYVQYCEPAHQRAAFDSCHQMAFATSLLGDTLSGPFRL